MEIHLEGAVMVRSPLYLKIKRGEVFIWRCLLDEGSVFRVDEVGVPVLVESKNGADIELSAGEIRRTSIPEEWSYLVEEGVEEKTLVLGETDVGKSSLIVYTMNTIVSREGGEVSLLDSDIGQKDLGPVGTISLASFREGPILPWLKTPEISYFVGDKTPRGNFTLMLAGVSLLERNARAPTFINTTGYLRDMAAVELKLRKIELLEPQLIVGIESGSGAVSRLLNKVPPYYRRIVLRCPPQVGQKSRDLRASLRKANISKYLRGASELDLCVEEIFIQGLELEKDEVLSKCLGVEVYRSEERKNIIKIISSERPAEERILFLEEMTGKRVEVWDLTFYRNLYTGLLNERGLCMGVGLIKDLSIKEGKISVLTTVSHKPKGLRLGKLRFSEDGEEIVPSKHKE